MSLLLHSSRQGSFLLWLPLRQHMLLLLLLPPFQHNTMLRMINRRLMLV
jgi:hypothetical protein